MLAETAAVVLATAMLLDLLGPDEWSSILVAVLVMFVVLFVLVGVVGPPTAREPLDCSMPWRCSRWR